MLFVGDCNVIARLGRRLRLFARQEGGSATIEAMLWIPLFFFVLVMAVEASQICVTQSVVMRVVQDGNRSFALGRLDANPDLCKAGGTVDAPQTDAFITAALAKVSPRATIDSKVNCSTKVLVSTVRLPISDGTGFSMIPMARKARITDSAQEGKEF